MKIVCAECDATYNIPDEKLPKERVAAPCKQCGAKIIIEPADVVVEPAPAASELPAKQNEQAAAAASAFQDLDAPEMESLLATYPELNDVPSDRLAFSEIFERNKKGSYKNRRNKLRVKILCTLAGRLPEILKPREKIYKVGIGTAYYPAEMFLGNGLLTMLYNYYALLATDQRVLGINVNARADKVLHFFHQYSYASLRKVKTGWIFGSICLYPKQGKRRLFNRMQRAIAKNIAGFITRYIPAGSELPAEKTLTYNHLCPACYSPLPFKLESCTNCDTPFKTAKKAAMRSMLLPGMGDMYLGHRFLGGVELLGSLAVWFLVIAMFLSNDPGTVVIGLMLLFFYNGMDGLLTYFMGQKGYILEKH